MSKHHGNHEGSEPSSIDSSSMACYTDIDISKLCCSKEEIESTRISMNSTCKSVDRTSLDSTAYKSVLFKSILEDDFKYEEVSIYAKLVNLIFMIYSDWSKLCDSSDASTASFGKADHLIMRISWHTKALKTLSSALCSVHEAVGLDDLKSLTYTFNEVVTDAWSHVKSFVDNLCDVSITNFKCKILRMLELAGGLSLAGVDHLKLSDDELYLDKDIIGELRIYFLKNQVRFFMTMLDEALDIVDECIEDMKQFQLSSLHEMSGDVVDAVMNILTSMITLFQRCQDLMVEYISSVLETSGQYFVKECYLLRQIITSIVDFNENVNIIVDKSKRVAENCDALEDFLEAPIIIADASKCICNTATDLIEYIILKKKLKEKTVSSLREALEKFVFSGKTVRVGVAMIVEEVEKDLNVTEDLSVVNSFFVAESTFAKKASWCPLNVSKVDVSTLNSQLQNRFRNDYRSSSGESNMSDNRYIEVNKLTDTFSTEI